MVITYYFTLIDFVLSLTNSFVGFFPSLNPYGVPANMLATIWEYGG